MISTFFIVFLVGFIGVLIGGIIGHRAGYREGRRYERQGTYDWLKDLADTPHNRILTMGITRGEIYSDLARELAGAWYGPEIKVRK